MSKMDKPYVPPQVTKHSCEGWYTDSMKRESEALSEIKCPPRLARDDDAEYTKERSDGDHLAAAGALDLSMIVGTDSNVASGLAPPIHVICDTCWKAAAMEPLGWTIRGEGAVCCFCGAFTASGKQVAYWALDVICENKH